MEFWIWEEMKFDFNKYSRIYTADFETSTPEWYDKEYQKIHYGIEHNEEEHARIWAWDICNSKYEHTTGTNLMEFMIAISRLPNNAVVCFHNLAFDGTFIISWLLEQGFVHVLDHRPRRFEFQTCISSKGQHYAYEITFIDGKTIVIMDSLKYIMASVKEIARMYNLPIKKGECDYKRYRYPDEPISNDDLEYIHNDTEIMARAIALSIDHGMVKFTQAGNAKYEFKKTFSKNDYEFYFPELDTKTDGELRRAYVGGFTYVNPKYKGIDLGNMVSMDYNSMYPSQMLFMPMPYGEPLYGAGKFEPNKPIKGYDLCIQRFKCRFALKENHVPMIAYKKLFFTHPDSYMTDSGMQVMELVLSTPDIMLFFDNYDVWDIEYIDYYAFRSMKGRFINASEAKHMTKDEVIEESGKGSLYYKYFLKWRKIKEYSSGTERAIAKRMQNALYGAEACNPIRDGYEPYLDDNGILKYKLIVGKEAQPMYLPAAIFTTAWSRYALITAINKYHDRFVYCDTDSLYMLGEFPPKEIALHDTLYGFFKVEHIIKKARFLGAKRYIYYARTPNSRDYKWEIACCGANEPVKKQMCWTNFKADMIFNGKLSMKTLKGGKHLVTTTYRLSTN